MGRSAIFVDLSSLNVLYKVDDRFVAVLSYKDGVERICATLPSLGVGYDIYLCMKPRLPGEGDVVIDELSIPGFPFTVDKEELTKVLEFFQGLTGYRTIYLCNWLQNFINVARVRTFKAGVFYGSRVLYLEVKNRIIEQAKAFSDSAAFMREVPDADTAYGDIGLADIDGLKAQYPEFLNVHKGQLTAVAPLLLCGTSTMYVDVDNLSFTEAKQVPQGEHKEAEPVIEKRENLDSTEKEIKHPQKRSKRNPRARSSPKGVFAVWCILMALIAAVSGAGLSFSSAWYEPVATEEFREVKEERIALLNGMNAVYTRAPFASMELPSRWDYIARCELPLEIMEYRYDSRGYCVRVSVSDPTVKDEFVTYLSSVYTVVSADDFSVSEVEGKAVYQFEVLLEA